METNAISTSHNEAKQVVTKRVIVFGKTLYRELGGKKLTEEVIVNGKKTDVDSPFTLINAKDSATGETLTQGIFIPHRGASARKLEHLCVDVNAYPNTNGNIELNFSDKPHLCRTYDVTLLWIPKGGEYQDKDGNWHPYRKTETYLLQTAIEVASERTEKLQAVAEIFEMMQGHSYDATKATPEDKEIYLSILRSL